MEVEGRARVIKMDGNMLTVSLDIMCGLRLRLCLQLAYKLCSGISSQQFKIMRMRLVVDN